MCRGLEREMGPMESPFDDSVGCCNKHIVHIHLYRYSYVEYSIHM